MAANRKFPPRRGPGNQGAPQQQTVRAKPIGTARRSHLTSTFGPGAVVDFRSPAGAPISALVTGLEEWDGAAPDGQKGLLHPQQITEHRLMKRLLVDGFRLPPVQPDEDLSTDRLPVRRFPHWLTCPVCERLAPATQWSSNPPRPERWCADCSPENQPEARVFAAPVRVVVACRNAHLGEFPWRTWIGCGCATPKLFLVTEGAGLSGKVVRCKSPGCKSTPRSLDGVFHEDTLANMKIPCSGGKPWLAAENDKTCTEKPRALQRGATSIYYSSAESAIAIPPFVNLDQIVGPQYATDLMKHKEEKWPAFIELNDLTAKTGLTAPVLLKLIGDCKRALDADDPSSPLEWGEYQQLAASEKVATNQTDFQTRPGVLSGEFTHYFGGLVLGHRLREVRALTGFTRIKPPEGPFRDPAARKGLLYEQKPAWLPAIELRGEGIFLRFNQKTVEEWEQRKAVLARSEALLGRLPPELLAKPEKAKHLTSPRFLLLHSFAHAWMRQLSLSCGYSSAALRERLYVGTSPYDMMGVLVHTGSADSEGTLGGLVRQGRKDLLDGTIRDLLLAQRWCSSDPLCITNAVTLSSPQNLAACHACLLAPETSCQHFNVFLDRATLVGTPDNASVGYFSEYLADIG